MILFILLIVVIYLIYYFFFKNKIIHNPDNINFYEININNLIKDNININDNIINYHAKFNDNNHNTIIFFHSNIGNLTYFNYLLNIPNSNIVIFDYPGYGKSKGIKGEINIIKSSRDFILEIIKKYNLKDVYLYGYQFGINILSGVLRNINHNYIKGIIIQNCINKTSIRYNSFIGIKNFYKKSLFLISNPNEYTNELYNNCGSITKYKAFYTNIPYNIIISFTN